MFDPEAVARDILEGDRRALAKAITLVESTRADHREQAVSLLQRLAPHAGKAIRVGISGAPGAGKSTFIETIGNHILDQGHKLAVLAVDPSSALSGWRQDPDGEALPTAGGVYQAIPGGRQFGWGDTANPRDSTVMRGRRFWRGVCRNGGRRTVRDHGSRHDRYVSVATIAREWR